MTTATQKPLRIDVTAMREGYRAMRALGAAVKASTLEPALMELVKMRASQINGCAYCIDMHSKDARAAGESEQRLYGLSAWQEAPYYSERERAALALTDALTRLPSGHPVEGVYDEVLECFTDEEAAALVYLIVEINAWNRIAISGGAPVGSYQPGGGA